MGMAAFSGSAPLPESLLVEQEREARPAPRPGPAIPVVPRNIDPISLLLAMQPCPVAPEGGSAAPAPLEVSAQPDESAQPEVSPAEQAPEVVPWWPSEAPARDAAAFIPPRSSRVAVGHLFAADIGQKPAAESPQAEDAVAYETSTRLSALRRLFFPAGNNEASPRDDSALNNASASDPDRAMTIESIAPLPMQEPVDARGETAVARDAALHWLAAEPKSPPPHPEAAAKELLAKKSYDESAFDGIQTLPARPGQYRC